MTTEQRISALIRLTEARGRIEDITDEELSKVGYKRLPGGRVVFAEKAELVLAGAIEAAKPKIPPFTPFEVVGATTGEVGRHIVRTVFLHNSLSRVLGGIAEISEVFPEQSGLVRFAKQVEEELGSIGQREGWDQETTDLAIECFVSGLRTIVSLKGEMGIDSERYVSVGRLTSSREDLFDPDTVVSGFLSRFTDIDDQGISSDNSKRIAQELEKVRNSVSEEDWEKLFLDYLGANFPADDDEFESDDHELPMLAKIREVTTKMGIITRWDLIMYVLADLLAKTDHSENIKACVAVMGQPENGSNLTDGVLTISRAIPKDKKLYDDRKAKAIEVINRVRSTLQGANYGDAITGLNEERKLADKAWDQYAQVANGFRDFLRLPERTVESIRRQLSELEKYLSGRQSVVGDVVTVEVDPRLDLDGYDRDPGQLNSDCTEGVPLPFAEKKYSVSNMKLFSRDRVGKRVYLGSCYLLETNDFHGKIRVWHFDACQLISPSVDWKKTFGVIIARLGELAQAAGVEAITVNEDLSLMSNLDRIAIIISEMADRVNRRFVLGIPDVHGREYSKFQGDGNARAIWAASIQARENDAILTDDVRN